MCIRDRWNSADDDIWQSSLPPLHVAANANSCALAKLLIEGYDFQVNARLVRHNTNVTPLQLAITAQGYEVVELLLSLGADQSFEGIWEGKLFQNAEELVTRIDYTLSHQTLYQRRKPQYQVSNDQSMDHILTHMAAVTQLL